MEAANLETRWIILGTDGRHVFLGRHSDPSPEELAQVEAGLAAQGLAGWLPGCEPPGARGDYAREDSADERKRLQDWPMPRSLEAPRLG